MTTPSNDALQDAVETLVKIGYSRSLIRNHLVLGGCFEYLEYFDQTDQYDKAMKAIDPV